MKKLIATTAISILLAGGAAYGASVAPLTTYQYSATDIRASQLIGQTVYAAETPVDLNMPLNDPDKNWANIGEINDVVLGSDQSIRAAVIGVGGFLGMGEKDVAVSIRDVKFIKDGDSPESYFLVVNATKDALDNAPAYVLPTDPNTTAATIPDSGVQATIDENRTKLIRPDVMREGYQTAQMTEVTADKLTGARVYGAKDEDVGEINRLVMADNGQVQLVVLDIGGFLGIGEHEIAVTPDELTIVRNKEGDDFRVYIDANKDALKAQPDYKPIQ
ncbi:PRC-barrel domain-containing protein [Rhizobium sp. KVB221]|uniref:PRC-barrel domain-containing protein n=1 Tax=Rhizobium setariae TaxID=2801340 RepID=A0A936YTD3_9HYPH|nr:PRC-barrel domain-containing protein [Rhizobium setariae]MBL0374552.1 PRC-barrel domain-containing protein [Rhizobium setariae]MBL0375487.1 PRC-barrel domain-containing protein [Rhizobium setariae]